MVLDLRDEAALDPALSGGKAAALAKAGRGGLNPLPGIVLTTSFSDAVDAGATVVDHPAVREVFEQAGGGTKTLIARSSSVIEDTSTSSMAGQFATIADIRDLRDLERAVQAVLDSRARTGAGAAPMAVLVQPMVEPAVAGVLFGIDPVTGRTDRRVVSAVEGSPEPLVSGAVVGARYVLDERGRAVYVERDDGPRLRPRELRRLGALATQVAEVFGGPQDVEWAVTTEGHLLLLQSRPVTTEANGVPVGPVYGPGPIAETFPEPLTELEQDLWVPPLKEALAQAVRLAGTASKRDVAASAIVVTVRGHVGIDLRLAGELVERPSLLQRLNPVPPIRRLRGAWRVGRLRSALPSLAEHLLDRTDADLRAVPPLQALTNRQLLALLHRSRDALRAHHAHEILMGLLVDTATTRMTGASIALRVLIEAREDGLTDSEILEHSPVVLALVPPRISARSALPATADTLSLGPTPESGNEAAVLREALRLRARWVQELASRAAWELGERLVADGDLPDVELIRHLTLDHLDAIITKRAIVVPGLVQAHHHDFGTRLPARFRMSDTGQAISVPHAREAGGGTGAGGGIARGPVTHDASDPPPGSVLVTTTLSPGLGPRLVHLVGIVAETGSVLSHLAILAREANVATVVGYAGAVEDLPEGTVVTVDGDTGRVTVEPEDGTR
jgi:pyruvate,water dikinase